MDYLDYYFKKIINYKYRGKNLLFKVSQSLFSSHDVDIGTSHLLRTLSSEGFDKYEKVLDLGCGYGVIGIALKSFYEPSIVHMVDRDALAIDFSKLNVHLNNMKGMQIYGSLGYDNISEKDFDLVVSNIPAKVGEPVLAHLLEDARFYVKPNGRIAIVVTDPIGEYVVKILESNKNIKILFHKRWSGHLVFHYEFLPDAFVESSPKHGALESNVYYRGTNEIQIKNRKHLIRTVYGIPEFDTLSFETEMILNKISFYQDKHILKAIVFNPGQGYIPSILSNYCNIDEIDLYGRDLEALLISKENLITNGYLPERIHLVHASIFMDAENESVDFVVGKLDENDDFKIHKMLILELIEKLSSQGTMITSASTTPITRIESFLRKERLAEIVEHRRFRGKSVMTLKINK